MIMTGFPRGSVVKNLPTNAEDTGSVLIWEDSTRWGANEPMCHSYRACALECGAGTTEPSSELLSPRAATTEACMPWSSATKDATAMRSSRTATRVVPAQSN